MGGAVKRVPRALSGAVVVAAALLVGEVHGAARAAESPYAALDLFAQVLTQIRDHYVDPIPQRDLVYRALDGVGNALDPHSQFLTPDALARLREESEGQFVGIGAQMRAEVCGLLVTGVLDGGPADRAGIAPGDCLVSADGTSLGNLGFDDALALVRGQDGEAVTLGVSRGAATRMVPVLRTRLLEASVDGEALGGGTLYLRVRQFRPGTAADLAAKVAELAGGGPVKGAVLDLRENPGGRVDEAVAMVDLFLSNGPIVSTHGRGIQADEHYDATSSRGDWEWPVVVLVDGQTASAAEIVAGALQDRGRARLIGEPTYGKGSVQSVFEYPDGSALKLTVARYHLPSGRVIQDRHGLQPDVAVAAASVPGPRDQLRRQLETVAGLSETDRAALVALTERIPSDRTRVVPDRRAPFAERLSQDPILAAGVALIRK